MIRKRNIGKSLLFSLLVSNVIMVVVGALQTAFGQQPNYGLSFCVSNAAALLWGLFGVLGSDWSG